MHNWTTWRTCCIQSSYINCGLISDNDKERGRVSNWMDAVLWKPHSQGCREIDKLVEIYSGRSFNGAVQRKMKTVLVREINYS